MLSAPLSQGIIRLTERITVTYRLTCTSRDIEARARAIAVEQSVEMPLEAITDEAIRRDVVGEVQHIVSLADAPDVFEVRIGLALATFGGDAGQLLNMLFGNTSLHDDVMLYDVELTPALIAAFGGPAQGVAGLRARLGAPDGRALTCSAIKPQGLPPEALAKLAERLALGGLDYVKDDHGLADQGAAPFAERVRGCRPSCRRAHGPPHPLRAEPERQPRRIARASADRAGRRAGHGDGRADDRRPLER